MHALAKQTEGKLLDKWMKIQLSMNLMVLCALMLSVAVVIVIAALTVAVQPKHNSLEIMVRFCVSISSISPHSFVICLISTSFSVVFPANLGSLVFIYAFSHFNQLMHQFLVYGVIVCVDGDIFLSLMNIPKKCHFLDPFLWWNAQFILRFIF